MIHGYSCHCSCTDTYIPVGNIGYGMKEEEVNHMVLAFDPVEFILHQILR